MYSSRGDGTADNFITDEAPGFVDAAHIDSRLKADSIVYRKISAFREVPCERIGPYADEYRATWPCAEGASSRASAR